MHLSDRVTSGIVPIMAVSVLALYIGLVLYMAIEAWPALIHMSWTDIVTGTIWKPMAQSPVLGLAYIISASLYVSLLSLIWALPFGIGTSVGLSLGVSPRIRQFCLSTIDMIAGIPSVIVGFIGLAVVVPAIQSMFSLSTGESILSASLVLAFMILPYIVTHCTESIETYRQRYEETALGLGISPWHTMKAIILPSAKGSIILSSVLAFSRAMGETMAVMMVVGNAPILPNLLGKAEPIPSLIALEMGSVEYNSLHYSGLYVAALILLIILILTNVLVYMYSWKTRKDGHHEVI